jgi:hypothetical protein
MLEADFHDALVSPTCVFRPRPFDPWIGAGKNRVATDYRVTLNRLPGFFTRKR